MSETPLRVTDELRAEMRRVLKFDCHLKPNLTREDARALKEVKQDKCGVITMVERGQRWWY